MSDFARWLNGSLTRFCGHEMHAHCHGIIHTLGIESSCLCDCHQRAAAPQPLDVERLVDAANAVLYAARKRPVTQEEERALALLDEAADIVGARLGSQEGSAE